MEDCRQDTETRCGAGYFPDTYLRPPGFGTGKIPPPRGIAHLDPERCAYEVSCGNSALARRSRHFKRLGIADEEKPPFSFPAADGCIGAALAFFRARLQKCNRSTDMAN